MEQAERDGVVFTVEDAAELEQMSYSKQADQSLNTLEAYMKRRKLRRRASRPARPSIGQCVASRRSTIARPCVCTLARPDRADGRVVGCGAATRFGWCNTIQCQRCVDFSGRSPFT